MQNAGFSQCWAKIMLYMDEFQPTYTMLARLVRKEFQMQWFLYNTCELLQQQMQKKNV